MKSQRERCRVLIGTRDVYRSCGLLGDPCSIHSHSLWRLPYRSEDLLNGIEIHSVARTPRRLAPR